MPRTKNGLTAFVKSAIIKTESVREKRKKIPKTPKTPQEIKEIIQQKQAEIEKLDKMRFNLEFELSNPE